MNRYRNLSIALFAGMLLTGLAGNAWAAWTSAACLLIENQAELTYSVGGVDQTNGGASPLLSGTAAGNTNKTGFRVATLVDLTVSAVNMPTMATGNGQVLTYLITNTGNDTQRYALELYTGANTQTFDPDGAGPLAAVTDNFDMSSDIGKVVKVYTDSDANYGNGTTKEISANAATDGTRLATLTDNVAANGSVYVHVVADVPSGQAAGSVAIYTLKAITHQIATLNGTDGSAGTETGNSATDGNTQNGCAGGSTGVALIDIDADTVTTAVGGAIDGPNDGDYYATNYYVVRTADISMIKRVVKVVWDPVNFGTNPVAIPGAYVQYEIKVTNAVGAGASATLSTITDTLQAGNLVIDPDLITGGDSTPANGPYEADSQALGAGHGFKVVVSGSTRADEGADQFFTTASDADGVEHAGGTITASFATILPLETGSAPGNYPYTAGELAPGESVTLTFNAKVQ